jgi:hypothetical protein
MEMSQALSRALDPEVPGSVGELLAGVWEKKHESGQSEDRSQGSSGENSERFGLFLWLRVPPASARARTPYALNLVGASPYYHHSAWTMRREVPIAEDSAYPVAQAVYRGGAITSSLPLHGEFTLWRGTHTCPVRIDAALPPRTLAIDSVMIGAIALNSTHPLGHNAKFQGAEPSILHNLSAPDLAELTARLERAAVRIVTAGPGLALLD